MFETPRFCPLIVILLTACGDLEPMGRGPVDAQLASPERADASSTDAGVPDADASDADASDAGPSDAGENLLPVGLTGIESIGFDDPFPHEALARMTAEASVVSVGETVHFSLGYARARARVIRSLIEDLGFRAVAFEGTWTDGLIANEYVHGQGTDQDLLRGLTFGAWMNQPTVRLFHFIREWNLSGRDPIEVFSFDIQDPTGDGLMIRELVSGLRAKSILAPDEVDAIERSLEACPGASARSVEEAYSTHPDASLLLLETPLSSLRREACLEAIALGRGTFARVDGQLSSRERTFSTVAYRSLAAFIDELYFAYDYRRTNEARDHGMADVFELLAAEIAPGRRIVNFAHNGHNLRRAETIETEYGFRSYGTWLGERMGEAYAPIGFLAARVDWMWSSETGTDSWQTSQSNAVETMLAALGPEHLLVDLEAATADEGFFRPEVQYVHEHDLHRSNPLENYRGLFFMQSSEAWDGKAYLDD